MEQHIIDLGRSSLLAMARDLRVMHGIELGTDHTDAQCYDQGIKIIESQKKAQEQLEQERLRDEQYLASLGEEERTYVLLKRKYEPCEMGG